MYYSTEKAEILLENYTKTNVICSDHAEAMVIDLLLRERISNITVFTSPSAGLANGSAGNRLMDCIGDSGIFPQIYAKIPPEPDTECVRAMVKELEQYKPQYVIAIGGGSVMDAAKAAYLSWQSKMDIMEMFGVNKVTEKFPDEKFKRVICLPTTSGTGSEATPYSNIVDHTSGVKRLIMEEALIPQWAFVNPVSMATMPEDLTVTTALDALVHLIESYLNTAQKDFPAEAPQWALEGIKLITGSLPALLEDPENLPRRKAVALGATLGGMCIAHRATSLPHLASFSLYGKIPHGKAVGALLAPFWRYYIGDPILAERTMELAGLFAVQKEETAEEVIASWEKFVTDVRGKARLSDYEILEKSIVEKIAKDALLNPMKLASCPRPLAVEEAENTIKTILEGAW